MMAKTLEQLKLLTAVGFVIVVGQSFGWGIPIVDAIPGIILVILVSQTALILKEVLPMIKFPAFAWATIISFVLSMPFMPTQAWFLGTTSTVNFLGTTPVILAFAGLSVGNKLVQLKKLSWKFFVIAVAVFIGTFFGSAIIAQIVLKFQGII
ncbi:MAG: hypothetical protein AVO33_11090 [delta proteobacterium ML8_F1]|nr:MAG: hypothetical protein AVO33_11090 [delta proteobacterium ML8_F1]